MKPNTLIQNYKKFIKACNLSSATKDELQDIVDLHRMLDTKISERKTQLYPERYKMNPLSYDSKVDIREKFSGQIA